MAIKDLFDCIICCSCGLCCSNNSLCENCEIGTLKANGLPEEFAPQIRGLKKKSYNHGGSFEYSELYKKIIELSKQEYTDYQSKIK